MSRSVSILALMFLVLSPGLASAKPGGMIEIEGPQLHGGGGGVSGCGCHSSLLRPPNSPTQVMVLGLPADGYVPGTTYDLQVLVLGVPLPPQTGGTPTASSIAGFSLYMSQGELQPVDGTVRVAQTTECDLMENQDHERELLGQAGICLGESCAVKERSDGKCDLYDPSVPFCQTCDLSSDGDCRPCDDEVALAWEATHTMGVTSVPLDPIIDDLTGTYLDGNNRFFWDVQWTAPASGKVRVNVAGNVANGDNSPDSGDLWNFGERVYLCEQGVDCTGEDDDGGHH